MRLYNRFDEEKEKRKKSGADQKETKSLIKTNRKTS